MFCILINQSFASVQVLCSAEHTDAEEKHMMTEEMDMQEDDCMNMDCCDTQDSDTCVCLDTACGSAAIINLLAIINQPSKSPAINSYHLLLPEIYPLNLRKPPILA